MEPAASGAMGLRRGLHRINRLMRGNAIRAWPRRRGRPKDDGERSIIDDMGDARCEHLRRDPGVIDALLRG